MCEWPPNVIHSQTHAHSCCLKELLLVRNHKFLTEQLFYGILFFLYFTVTAWPKQQSYAIVLRVQNFLSAYGNLVVRDRGKQGCFALELDGRY